MAHSAWGPSPNFHPKPCSWPSRATSDWTYANSKKYRAGTRLPEHRRNSLAHRLPMLPSRAGTHHNSNALWTVPPALENDQHRNKPGVPRRHSPAGRRATVLRVPKFELGTSAPLWPLVMKSPLHKTGAGFFPRAMRWRGTRTTQPLSRQPAF